MLSLSLLDTSQYTCEAMPHALSVWQGAICLHQFLFSISSICYWYVQSTKYETCTEGIFDNDDNFNVDLVQLLCIVYVSLLLYYRCESSFVWMISMAMWKTMCIIYYRSVWRDRNINLQYSNCVYYNMGAQFIHKPNNTDAMAYGIRLL